MATAKRRQEEVEGVVAEGEDGCSDAETDGGGSGGGGGGGGGETAAKRLRRELEQQYRHWEPPLGGGPGTRGGAKKGKRGIERRRRIRRGPGAAHSGWFLAACSENNARVGSEMIAERLRRERWKGGKKANVYMRMCIFACLSSWFSRTLNATSRVTYGKPRVFFRQWEKWGTIWNF